MKCKLPTLITLLLLLGLAGCAAAPEPARPVDSAAMLERIDQIAASDEWGIKVTPWAAPGVRELQAEAHRQLRAGKLDAAATTLRQALTVQPDSPSILQAQAELLLRRHDWTNAQRKAVASFKKGPKVGPLCARNWQTVLEVRRVLGDSGGVATAKRWIKQCHGAM